jgi:putative transposase
LKLDDEVQADVGEYSGLKVGWGEIGKKAFIYHYRSHQAEKLVQLKKRISEKTFVLDRAFSPDRPNPVWVSDITYVRTYEGFLYLATVMDLFSRRIIGWAMDKHIDRHLVINALLMAIWQRQPKEEVLVHSDQGSQYASADYLAFMKEHNLTPSMSRRGNCHDNAVAESFFATIKKRVTKRKIYSTREEAKTEIFNFIEMFYNPIKRHSHTGGVSPAQYEEAYCLESTSVLQRLGSPVRWIKFFRSKE